MIYRSRALTGVILQSHNLANAMSVDCVERLFVFADQIETRLTQAQTHIARLTDATLARRKGRDYEPASALLKRVRAERAQCGDRPRGITGKGTARQSQPRKGHSQ